MKVSRRELAAMVSAVALGGATAPPAAAQSSDEETQSAHDLLRANAQAIAQVKLPMAVEPPFHFKA